MPAGLQPHDSHPTSSERYIIPPLSRVSESYLVTREAPRATYTYVEHRLPACSTPSLSLQGPIEVQIDDPPVLTVAENSTAKSQNLFPPVFQASLRPLKQVLLVGAASPSKRGYDDRPASPKNSPLFLVNEPTLTHTTQDTGDIKHVSHSETRTFQSRPYEMHRSD
ncbi:hypothetical protein H101_02686 [Trichophyton interdigitale H6]|nr:hypothetical protein H101_02686 [Trichophyton interdigitale H6]